MTPLVLCEPGHILQLDLRQCCLGGFEVVFFSLDIPIIGVSSRCDCDFLTPMALSTPLGSFLSHPSDPFD